MGGVACLARCTLLRPHRRGIASPMRDIRLVCQSPLLDTGISGCQNGMEGEGVDKSGFAYWMVECSQLTAMGAKALKLVSRQHLPRS